MKTIEEIYRDRLLLLIARAGTQEALADLIGKQPAQISQWKNRSADSKTGKPRAMDRATARQIEAALAGKPKFEDVVTGWMDQPIKSPFEPPGGATVQHPAPPIAAGPDPLAKPSLDQALPVVLDALAAAPSRGKLRVALSAILDDDSAAYRGRLLELLQEEHIDAPEPAPRKRANGA